MEPERTSISLHTSHSSFAIERYREMPNERPKGAPYPLKAKEVQRIFSYRIVGFMKDYSLDRFETFFQERVDKLSALESDRKLYSKLAIKGAIQVSNLQFVWDMRQVVGPAILNERDECGMTPLYLAVNYKEYWKDVHTNPVTGLILREELEAGESYKRINRHKDYSFKVAKTVIELGADVNALSRTYKFLYGDRDDKRNECETPLDAAARNNDERMIQYLYLHGAVTHLQDVEALANIDRAMHNLIERFGLDAKDSRKDPRLIVQELKEFIGANELDGVYGDFRKSAIHYLSQKIDANKQKIEANKQKVKELKAAFNEDLIGTNTAKSTL